MLTPQEVTNVVFEKAVFGGYEITAVDKFLNQLTKDYSALYRDNELLKNRLSAMTDKIEEYRANEDAMRLALLSAKKAAKESEERVRAAQEAAGLPVQPEITEPEATERLKKLAAELKREEAALERARKTTETYLARFREATAACEEALTELYAETEQALPVTEIPEPVSAEAAELSFADLNFGRS